MSIAKKLIEQAATEADVEAFDKLASIAKEFGGKLVKSAGATSVTYHMPVDDLNKFYKRTFQLGFTPDDIDEKEDRFNLDYAYVTFTAK